MIARKTVQASIDRLDRWLDRNGWEGYDPYSVKGQPLFIFIQKLPRVLPFKVLKYLLFMSVNRQPRFWINLLGVKRSINAKGMGLLAKAYLNLYQESGQEVYAKKAKKILQWLEAHPSQGYPGISWGYPFDWQSTPRHLIPAGTPSSVVSYAVGDAFWSAYKIIGEKKYLEICKGICEFFMKGLIIDRIDPEEVCFSYTPLRKNHIHNANLFAAEFLIRIGKETGIKEYLEFGQKAVNYSVNRQNQDGSFYYFGLEDLNDKDVAKSSIYSVDDYHNGFILRSLKLVYQHTRSKNIEDAFKKCSEFYLNNFFTDGLPRRTPKAKPFPIDIHQCSEAILSLAELVDACPEAREKLDSVLSWTINNMQNGQGSFYYQRQKSRMIKFPYLRWGQAWMLLALSEVLKP